MITLAKRYFSIKSVRVCSSKQGLIFQTYLEALKTKLTKNYTRIHPSKITTTVGLNIGKIDVAGVRLNFWDLGGQTELQSLWDKVPWTLFKISMHF